MTFGRFHFSPRHKFSHICTPGSDYRLIKLQLILLLVYIFSSWMLNCFLLDYVWSFFFSPKVLHRKIRGRHRTPLLPRSACRAQTRPWTSRAVEENENIRSKSYISLRFGMLKVYHETFRFQKNLNNCMSFPNITTRCQ